MCNQYMHRLVKTVFSKQDTMKSTYNKFQKDIRIILFFQRKKNPQTWSQYPADKDQEFLQILSAKNQ